MTNLSIKETKDGSITFYNKEVDECYHSISGAIEEALEKHVKPSGMLKINKDEIVIGDLFFGLGYNSIVAMEEFFKIKPKRKIKIIAFENDINILNKIKELKLENKYKKYQEIIISLLNQQTNQEIKEEKILNKKRISEKEIQIFQLTKEDIDITLYLGDILETIKLIKNETFDVVFYDPFSPKKHPHLWTEKILKEVYRIMKKKSTLTTYSCARIVRDNMKLAKFEVKDGPSVGRKSPSTIAIKE